MGIYIFLYVIQFIIVLFILGEDINHTERGNDFLRTFKTKSQIYVSFIPFIWIYLIIGLVIEGFKDVKKNIIEIYNYIKNLK